ncbi:MAG: hypothetical protein WC379_04550 [Methanoregula sp.]
MGGGKTPPPFRSLFPYLSDTPLADAEQINGTCGFNHYRLRLNIVAGA